MKEHNEGPVVTELRNIKKLLALSLIKGEPFLREQIKLLNQYGFQQKEISELLRIPRGTVSSNLARAKQSNTKKSKEKNNQD